LGKKKRISGDTGMLQIEALTKSYGERDGRRSGRTGADGARVSRTRLRDRRVDGTLATG
jgi:hypothetical protein